MSNNEQPPPSSQFLLYQDDNGVTNVNVRFDGTDVWLAQAQIALLFDTTQQNVSQHINAVIEEGELPREATHKNFLLVRREGRRSVQRQIEHYNLDMIMDFAELQAVEQNSMTMRQWVEKLDDILAVGNRPLLQNAGTVSHDQAIEKATKEFEEYRRREMLEYESDFDRAIKELTEKARKNSPEPDAK
jgi:hypothetical protein